MARSIGSIEIIVDARTNKLKAKVVKASKEAGEAGGEALEEGLSDVDGRELIAKLRKIRVQAQRAMAGMEVDIDIHADASSELKRVEAQVKAAQIELALTPEVNDADLQRMLAEVRENLRAARLKPKAEFEFSARQAAAEADEALAHVDAKLAAKLVLEPTAIQKINAEIDAKLRDIRAQISEIDGGREIALVRAQIEASLRGFKVGIEVNEARAKLRAFAEESEALQLQLSAVLEDQDLTKIATKVRAFTAEQRTIFFDTDADLTDVEARIEELEAQDHTVKILAELDAAFAEARLEKLAAERREAQITAVLDADQFRADVLAAQMLARRRTVEIPIAGDLTEINRSLESLRVLPSTRKLDISIGAQIGEIEAALARYQGADIRIPVDADLTKIRAALTLYRELQQNNDIELPVDLDLDAMDAALARAEAAAATGGSKSGKSFGRSFASSLSDQGTLIIGAVTQLAPHIAQALSGGAAAASSVLGSGFAAIGAAAGAAAPLVAGFGAAIGAVIVGSRGFGDAMGAIDDEFAAAAKEGRAVNLETGAVGVALSKLAPSARDTAVAFAGFRDELHNIKLNTQQQLFSGFADVVEDLGRDVLPQVDKALQITAVSVNKFGIQLADVAKKTDWEGVAKGLKPALDDAFDAATALVETIEPFLKAASPAADRLAKMIEKIAENMRDWVRTNPKQLADFLDDGLDSLEAWGDLTASVTRLLVKFFGAGKTSGDSFVDSLDDMIDRWNGFLETTEGQEDLKEFFESGKETMEALKPVLDGLQEAFGELLGDSGEQFADLADSLARALPDFAELLSITANLGLVEAFVNIMDAAGPLFDLLNMIPDVVFELVGQFYALYKTTKLLAPAFTAATSALKVLDNTVKGVAGGLTRTNGILLAIGAAVSVALIAYDHFTGKNEEAEQAAEDFGTALEGTIDTLLRVDDATEAARVGVEAFNTTLAEGDTGKEISKALGILNHDLDDSRAIMSALADDSVTEMTRLGVSFGLPEGGAESLAKMVDRTSESFEDYNDLSRESQGIVDLLARKYGKTTDEIVDAAWAMETLTDETDKAIPKQIEIAELGLAAAKGMGAEEQAALKMAEANQEAGLVAEGVIPLHDEYLRILKEQAIAAVDAADGEAVYVNELAGSEALLREANALAQERADALEVSRSAAYNAWQEEEKLKDETKDAAIAAADAIGFHEDLGEALFIVGEKARGAAEAADAMKSVFDLLISPTVDVEKAFLNMEQVIDDYEEVLKAGTTGAVEQRAEAEAKLAEAIEEGTSPERAEVLKLEADELFRLAEAAEAGVTSMDRTTDAGQANIGMMHDYAAGIVDTIAALIAEGASTEEVIANQKMMREGLVQMADQFGRTRPEAEAYVDTLLGTPAFMETLITAPGLMDLLLDAESLTVVYDEMGRPIVTEIEALGLDESVTQSQVFYDMLEALGVIDVAPTVDPAGTAEAAQQAEDTTIAYDELGQLVVEPTVTPPEVTAQDAVTTLTTDLTTLDGMAVTPTITIPNILTTIDRVEELDRLIDNLKNKTITITVNQRNTGQTLPGSGRPAVPTADNMAGGIINFPTVTRVGERGYREAIIPLDLPLNRVNPEVRQLAALLQGGGGNTIKLPAGRTVNNYMTITPQSADPEVVATKIINRAAALANV